MKKSAWMGPLGFILLGVVLGFAGGRQWLGSGSATPGDVANPVAPSPAEAPLVEHIEAMFERLVALHSQEFPTTEDVTATNRVEVPDDAGASGFAGFRKELARIERDLAELNVAVAPPDAHLMPAKGKFYAKKTELVEETLSKLQTQPHGENDPDPRKSITDLYFGWTPQQIYATFGAPDWVGTYAGRTAWLYNEESPQLYINFAQGVVYDVHSLR